MQNKILQVVLVVSIHFFFFYFIIYRTVQAVFRTMVLGLVCQYPSQQSFYW